MSVFGRTCQLQWRIRRQRGRPAQIDTDRI
jgi:hypothetical protein